MKALIVILLLVLTPSVCPADLNDSSSGNMAQSPPSPPAPPTALPAPPAPPTPPQRPDLGKWWKNSAIVRDLGLSNAQISDIEQSFLAHRLKLVDIRAEL